MRTERNPYLDHRRLGQRRAVIQVPRVPRPSFAKDVFKDPDLFPDLRGLYSHLAEMKSERPREPRAPEIKGASGMEHKTFQAEVKEADGNDLTITHWISSEKRDRGGDILYAGPNRKGRGMVVDGAPVVLFMHGMGSSGMEPIAKPLWIQSAQRGDYNGIMAKTKFYEDELGRRLWKKCKEGYLPNFSMGWIPLIHETKDDPAGETRHVYEWELLEYSLVGVPAQPDAQTLAFKIMGGSGPVKSSSGTFDEAAELKKISAALSAQATTLIEKLYEDTRRMTREELAAIREANKGAKASTGGEVERVILWKERE